MSKFAELKDEGRTVVVVSHGLEQMRTFCDDAVWLDHGHVKAVGHASDIIDSFADDTRQAKPVEGGGTRLGSGEIEVTCAELLGPDGQPVATTQTGDERLIRLHYRCNETVEKPVFGVNIDSNDGYWVWGLNGIDGGFIPDRLEPGEGRMDLRVPWLPLRPGSYTMSTSIQGKGGRPDYDIFARASRFAVSSSARQESAGVVAMNAQFEGFVPPRNLVR